MSLRSLTRAPPKRMLVFFDVDETTSILPTSRVKKIFNEDQKLESGAKVLVEYEKAQYEARILKLHDDPTVLSQVQIDFLPPQVNCMDTTDTDKENVPPAKKQKLCNTSDQKKLRKKQKDKEKTSKKIISIEAEDSPADEYFENSIAESVEPKPTKKPGSLDFLCPEEQIRVQRMLDLCEKGQGKDVSTQTEEMVQSQPMPTSCCCQNRVLANQGEIKRILKRLTEVTKKIETQENQHVVSDVSNMQCTLLVSPLQQQQPVEGSPSSTKSPEGNAEPLMVKEGQKSVTTSVNSPESFDEIFKRSSSMTNYAKNLVFSLFSKDELYGKNCAGVKGKPGIGNDPRMEKVREYTFKKYSVVDRNGAWTLCRKAIDSALRKLYYQKLSDLNKLPLV